MAHRYHKTRDTEVIRPCKLCGKPIRYMRVKRQVKGSNPVRYEWGGTMPVDTEIMWGDGKLTLVAIHPQELARRVIVKAGPEIQGVQSHFGTCSVYLKKRRRKTT